jgi:hypothetical protein
MTLPISAFYKTTAFPKRGDPCCVPGCRDRLPADWEAGFDTVNKAWLFVEQGIEGTPAGLYCFEHWVALEEALDEEEANRPEAKPFDPDDFDC